MILSAAEAAAVGERRIGGKARGLARLGALPAVLVPAWFVVAAEASVGHLARSGRIEEALRLQDEVAGGVERERLDEIAALLRAMVLDTPIDDTLRAGVGAALVEVGEGPYAVRSSMVGEDSAKASFAGQLESFLYQSADDVAAAVVRCWASAFTAHALTYRARSGAAGLPMVAVVVQRMVDGEVSGVAFSADPTTGRRDQARITATWGLCEGVVSGACNTDEFVVGHDGAVASQTLADKDTSVVRAPGGAGTVEVAVDEARRAVACLDTAQLAEIATTVARVAEAFGAPQDMEWTWADGRMHLLQARPITALPAVGEPDGPRVVFDNSNIQESYCGVTTPLTFSFAQGAYASVYEQTMRAVGLGDDVVDAHREMLRNMISLVRGRVYYNINNWYRGLLLLPSFGRNKEDMEAMMGLDVPVDFVEDQTLSLGQKLAKLPGMLVTFARLLAKFRGLPAAVPRFLDDFEAAYRRVDRSRFGSATYSELTQIVAQLRREMLENWSTPIINDTYVLMRMGALRRLVAKTGVENPGEVVNNLMSGEEGIESLEPTRALMRIARHAALNPDLHRLLKHGSPLEALAAIREERPDYAEQIDAYIERYGDRVIGELKLETITARTDPSFIITVLRTFAHRPDLDPDALAAHEAELRADAEKVLRERLGFWDRLRAASVLQKARTGVKYRENMRLARTRMFGLFRDAYAAMGQRLWEAGRLEDPRDVFYLTTDELLAYQEGRAVSADVAGIAAARKAEYAEYERLDLPHHFETRGPVYHGNAYEGPSTHVEVDPDAEVLQGTGCYPGVVEAPLRVVMSPNDNLDLEGHILTTLRTDPGWAPLFPASAGILVERGSTLSHSAVVARELGIPAVVGVPGLLKVVRDGEQVVLDGGAGTVRRLDGRDAS